MKKTSRSWFGKMVSEKQTTTEPKGATCHGKRNTKSEMVSKVIRADKKGAEERGQTRSSADMRVHESTGKIGI